MMNLSPILKQEMYEQRFKEQFWKIIPPNGVQTEVPNLTLTDRVSQTHSNHIRFVFFMNWTETELKKALV